MKNSLKTASATQERTRIEGGYPTNKQFFPAETDANPPGNSCSDKGPDFWQTPHEPRVALSNDLTLPEENAFRHYLKRQLPTLKAPASLLEKIKASTIITKA